MWLLHLQGRAAAPTGQPPRDHSRAHNPLPASLPSSTLVSFQCGHDSCSFTARSCSSPRSSTSLCRAQPSWSRCCTSCSTTGWPWLDVSGTGLACLLASLCAPSCVSDGRFAAGSCAHTANQHTPPAHPPPPADYCAAALIDRPWCGRMRMQAGGFLMLFLLFLLQGALFTSLEQHSGAFQVGDVHGCMGRPFRAVPMSSCTTSRPWMAINPPCPPTRTHPNPLSSLAAAILPVQLLCAAGAQLHHLPHRGRGEPALYYVDCMLWSDAQLPPRLERGACADAAAAQHHRL